MMDALHRALTGQTVSKRELVIGGVFILVWFGMDVAQFIGWLFESPAQLTLTCGILNP